MSYHHYIVQAGDTLQRILIKCIGNAARWKQVADYNSLTNPNQLYPGQTIKIPLDLYPKSGPHTTNKIGKKQHTVCYGDSLWKISANYLGNPNRWREIAFLNNLENPNQIFVGQPLDLPSDAATVPKPMQDLKLNDRSFNSSSLEHRPATQIPARAFFFVIADEFNPFTKTAVRKVIFPEGLQDNPELLKQILNPEKHGFFPRAPITNVSPGRHVLGMTNSKYISVSDRFMGSPRFEGKKYWINMSKLEKAGVAIYKAEDIAKDLDRIAAKTKNAEFLKYIEDIRFKSLVIDKESLVAGQIPPQFIKGAGAKALTHSLQFVQGIGIVISVYELADASYQSYEKGTPRPIVAETVRQAGGWASAVLGFKVGTMVGGLFGIETGPGALLTAGVGGLIFGTAGYFGADWIADYIYE